MIVGDLRSAGVCAQDVAQDEGCGSACGIPDVPQSDEDEPIVEQLTTLPGSSVKLRLEIDAEVPTGLDRAKVRTLVENANTLGFVEKSLE